MFFTFKKKKNPKIGFTLIELVVVVAIIAILASFILPNISGMNRSAVTASLTTSLASVQTASDMYYLKNSEYPTASQPTITRPKPIVMDKLVPEYIRNMPSLREDVFFWVDYTGKVWASTVDSPINIDYENGIVRWDAVEGAISYRIFELSGDFSEVIGSSFSSKGVTVVREVKASDMGAKPEFAGNPDKLYLVSAIDQYDLESAPAGKGYEGLGAEIEKSNDTGKPIAVIGMYPNQGVTINTTVIWANESYHLDGLDIVNEEWEGIQEIYPIEGLYTVRLRV